MLKVGIILLAIFIKLVLIEEMVVVIKAITLLFY